jgi:hypothetical protein
LLTYPHSPACFRWNSDDSKDPNIHPRKLQVGTLIHPVDSLSPFWSCSLNFWEAEVHFDRVFPQP